MKRTAVLALVSIGAGAVVFYALRDPGRTSEAHAYTTVQDCLLTGGVAEQRCREEYSRALAEHERTAPRYASRSECETEFGSGRCEERPGQSGGSSVFLPLLAGYMFGQLADRGGVATQPLYPARPDQCPPGAQPGQPNCPPQQRSGGASSSSGTAYRTGHGTTIWVDRGRTSSAPSTVARRTTTNVPRSVATPPPSRPRTVSRDGFGQTSRSVTPSSRSTGT
jgi:uncharacterized protein YgiB involved in biofilm formation